MKKVIAISLFFISLQAVFAATRPLANENKDGLYARSISQVLRLDPEQIDIGIAALIVSEQWSDIVAGRRCQVQLDEMAYEIRGRLEAESVPINHYAVPVINEYLFDELGFTSVQQADDPNDLFLHSVLKNKRGYCLSLSILYLAIGERLGLPLYGVVVPGHFFVRYDDGQVRFNIETTSSGGSAKDEHYMEKFKVPEHRENSIYMVNLNPLQTLGCFFNNLGNSYLAVGNISQAQLSLEKAVKINPTLLESRTNLGNIYLQTDRIDDAIYEYKYSLKLNRDDAGTHNNLGNAYAKKRQFNDAIAEYSSAIRLDSKFVDAYKNLAIIYCEQKLYAKAIARLQQALIIEPKNYDLYLQLGEVYRKKEDFNQAVIEYKKALVYNSDSADAYLGLGLCCKELGLADEEIEAYKNALAIEPEMAAALTNLGNVYFGRQDFDEAIRLYKHALALSPNEALLYYNLGAAYSNKEDYQQAKDAYLKAVGIIPDLADAHYGLAYCFYNMKDYQASRMHLKIAEQLGVEIDKQLMEAIERETK